MTSSFTTNVSLEEPAYSDYASNPTGWTSPINQNWTLIDTVFGGKTSLATLSGSTTLTATQYAPRIWLISGALTANVTYVIPANIGGTWTCYNNTTGAFLVTIKSANTGTTTVLPQGYRTQIFSDGSNIAPVNTAPGTAAGATSQVQFNSSGYLNGDSRLTVNTAAGGSSNQLALQVQGILSLPGVTSGNVGLQAPATGGTGIVWTLPAADGTSGQLLSTNGAGILSWGGAASGVTSFSGGSTGLTPASGASGNVTLGGTLAIANGGTGATTATGTGAVMLQNNPISVGLVDTQYIVASAPGPYGQFVGLNGSTSFAWRNDATNIYLLKNNTSASGFDSSRPFTVNLSTSVVSIDGTGAGTNFGASIGITGNVVASGNVTAFYSDRRLKTDITPIDDALAKVSRIAGVYFRANDEAKKYGYSDERRQVGVIAQDVHDVLPEVVFPAPFDSIIGEGGKHTGSRSGQDFVTVQYDKLAPLLIQGLKELLCIVETLQSRVNELEAAT